MLLEIEAQERFLYLYRLVSPDQCHHVVWFPFHWFEGHDKEGFFVLDVVRYLVPRIVFCLLLFYSVYCQRTDGCYVSRYDGIDLPVACSVLSHPRGIYAHVPVHVYEVQDPSSVRTEVQALLLMAELPACYAEECWEWKVRCDKAAEALYACECHRPSVLAELYFFLHLLPVETELCCCLLSVWTDVLHCYAAEEERLEVAEGVCWQVF